jgi:YD repeat-containing protein
MCSSKSVVFSLFFGCHTGHSANITATNPQNAALTFSATGPPAGLSLNTSTGAITGTLSAAVATYNATLSVFDGVFASTRLLKWSVIPAPPTAPPLAQVFDSFTSNGPIAPLTAHVPDVRPAGRSWVLWEGGAPTVDAGTAAATGGGTYVMASIDGGTANGIVAVDLLSTDAGPQGGLALRVADAGNYLVLRYAGEFGSGRVELLRRVYGAFSLVASAGVVPLDAASHRLEARMNGLGIGAYWDGRALFQMDVNDNATATRNGVSTSVGYDANRYWVTSIQAGPMQLTYGYDKVGNVTNVIDAHMGNQTFSYDALDRLATASGPYSMTFAYDAHGNRQTTATGTYTYYAGKPFHLKTASGIPGDMNYDGNGNLVSGPGVTLEYTPENMLKKSTAAGVVALFSYDVDQWRAYKFNQTTGVKSFHVRGVGNQLLSEWTNVTGSTAEVRDYIYAGSRLVAVQTASNMPTR